MLSHRTIWLAALLMVLFLASTRVSGQETTVPRAKPNKIVFNGSMAALLAQLADQYNVNISLEVDPAQSKAAIKIDFRFDTLDDILDGIVEAAPRYRWRNEDGFIDVYPHESSCVLLETVIDDLKVDNNEWLAASQALTRLPEVARHMSALGLIRHDLDKRTPLVTLFSLSLKNIKLRRALNEIAQKSNNRFWMFERYGQDGRFFSISNSPLGNADMTYVP